MTEKEQHTFKIAIIAKGQAEVPFLNGKLKHDFDINIDEEQEALAVLVSQANIDAVVDWLTQTIEAIKKAKIVEPPKEDTKPIIYTSADE